jgi:protein-L-isoaspartate(D-aspartate) O-methyltransferase
LRFRNGVENIASISQLCHGDGVTNPDFEHMRRAMVSNQLRTTAVSDPRVIAAMSAVPRERYVPPESSSLAYIDRSIPIGANRALNPPMTTGRLLTEAHPRSEDHALVIGAATGYASALLAELVESVVALEQDAALLEAARKAPASPRVTIVEGPLGAGWKKKQPYDLILIDGAVELVPQALIDQLADGGRLAVAIIDRGVTRLAIGKRSGKGFGLVAFTEAEAAPLPGFERPKSFSF